MNFFSSLVCGIVQGLTEFLPVSSQGHLAILQYIFGIPESAGLLMEVFLHVGTLAAVILAFRKELRKLRREGFGILKDLKNNLVVWYKNKFRHENNAYRKLIANGTRKFLMLVIVSAIPAALLGYNMRRLVLLSEHTLAAVGIGFLLTGIYLLVIDRVPQGEKRTRQLTYGDSLWIGISQVLAFFPGVSQSAMTTCTGILCGLGKKTAIRFSYIISIPVILGGMVFEISGAAKHGITASAVGYSIFGAVAACFVGFFTVQRMLKFFYKKKFWLFAGYSFAAGIAVLLSVYL